MGGEGRFWPPNFWVLVSQACSLIYTSLYGPIILHLTSGSVDELINAFFRMGNRVLK